MTPAIRCPKNTFLEFKKKKSTTREMKTSESYACNFHLSSHLSSQIARILPRNYDDKLSQKQFDSGTSHGQMWGEGVCHGHIFHFLSIWKHCFFWETTTPQKWPKNLTKHLLRRACVSDFLFWKKTTSWPWQFFFIGKTVCPVACVKQDTSSLLQVSSAKETCNLKEPTNRCVKEDTCQVDENVSKLCWSWQLLVDCLDRNDLSWSTQRGDVGSWGRDPRKQKYFCTAVKKRRKQKI